MNRLDDVIMSKPSDLRKIVSIIDFFNEMCDFSAFSDYKNFTVWFRMIKITN